MYKAQSEASKTAQSSGGSKKTKGETKSSPDKGGDDVQDVDFEEVK